MKLSSIVENHVELRQKADEWIKGWTFDSNSERDNFSGAEIAYKVYQLTDKPLLFRGLNFSSKEEFDKFKLSTQEYTRLNPNTLTSWTESEEQAATFALIDDEYDDSGYGGVVISLNVEQNHDAKLINAKKSIHGENEIIAFPGKFKIKLEQEKIHDPK